MGKSQPGRKVVSLENGTPEILNKLIRQVVYRFAH